MSSETVPDVFLVHSGMEIGYANPAFHTLVGVDSEEQLVGTALTDFVTSDYHAPLREHVGRIEDGEAPTLGFTVEFRTSTEHPQRAILVSSSIEWEGTERVHTSVLPIAGRDPNGRRLLYDRAMDEAPIGITIADPSQPGNPLVYVNDGFVELTGYPREETLGRNCRFLQGEDTREEPVARMREAIDAEEPVAVELRNYRRDGSMFWNRVTVVPIRNESGAVTNWLGYHHDVTAEKRYEQDLSLFKRQAEATDKAVLITDPEGTIEYVNPAFERLTGYTAVEATGRDPSILNSDQQDEEFYTELWEQITAGEVWEAELTNRSKHGELFEVEQKIVPVTDENGEITHFVGIEQDVTDRMLTTQTLDVLNRVLRHNLRNSLNVIDGYADLLEDEELDREARRTAIAAIREQAESMTTIAEKTAEIRDVWDRSDADRGWGRLDVESLVETYRRQYPDAEVTGTIEGGEIRVRNVELFKKAIDEAVENAIDHNDRSPPEVAIAVRREPDANQLRITVADNGPGIPELERQAIESGEETALSHGLGIDLWVMKWVSTMLGGELTFSDNEPRGSVVTFLLPIGGRTGT
ncbi:PAS domain-containing sensor histidine kinase [Halorubrum sp. 48-1-W]|uniref:PAS domain-containing protein n=1 Tax=Halorubrum sp. 48-1-W TaxID=2249761 RepID=UPI000DCB9A75|nr:PAS domain-containing protein [Halorubrum sp. 48-1-W]RAW45861.1 PAS domain-containing sensor histidine kinase [Halorubrum sp. 48-1-W]